MKTIDPYTNCFLSDVAMKFLVYAYQVKNRLINL